MLPWGSIPLTRSAGFGALPQMLEAQAGHRALIRTFEREGLPVDVIHQPQQPLPIHALMRVFARSGQEAGHRTFGLDVGERMTHQGFGLWVEYSARGTTFAEGLRRTTTTLWAHQTHCRIELIEAGAYVIWRYTSPPLEAKNHHHTDHIIGPVLQFARIYLGQDWRPDWIEVDYPRDPDTKYVEERLGVPLRHGYPGLGVPIRRDELERTRLLPLPPGGGRIVTLREVVADATLADAPEPARSLSAIIALRLMGGMADIDGAAQLANTSVQRLQRRLREKGFTYRQVVEIARRDRAVHMLRETDAKVVDIAFSLGYSEHAAFTRAFQRWMGCSPTQFRLSPAGRPPPPLVTRPAPA